MNRVGIVGAGIIGLSVARRVSEVLPAAEVTVLEKEHDVALHQTGRNSGVVHAGVYYAPGSLKARLCRRGVELLRAYCADRQLPLNICGKLIVAVDPSELERLDELQRRAEANGVPDIRRVDAEELRDIEPHAAGLAGLHSPTTAITDYRAIAKSLADDVRARDGSIVLDAEVTEVSGDRDRPRVRAGGRTYEFDTLILCAGLQSDRVARMAGDEREPRIVPFRGEYYRLVSARDELVRGLLYPVPDPAYPFLGIHFTRRIAGGVDVGPNAVLALAREGYRRRDVNPRDVAEIVASPGFRALARRHWRMGVNEVRGSLSRAAFAREARRYVPELAADDLVAAPAGVRAQALNSDGSLLDDFRITRIGRVTAVRNAPSPGATSSMAIAEEILAHAFAD